MGFDRRIIIAIAAAIAAAAIIGALAAGPADVLHAPAGLHGEVAIGAIAPLTGDLSAIGEENLEASALGVADFNAHLEEIGEPWRLVMVSEDSATSPVVALEKITSLKARGIDVVIGPETSSNIRNIKGYADANEMLLISCCSTAPELAISGDSVYRLVPDDANQGTALAELMRHEGIDVVVPVWRADAWGDGLRDAAAGSFEQRGGMVADGIRYNPEAPEFSASASLLAKSVQESADRTGQDRVAVLFLGFQEVLQFMQSAAEYESLGKVRWFGPDGTNKHQALVDDPIGAQFSDRVMFTSVQAAPSANPAYERVQGHVEDVLGRTPNAYVHPSYDAVWLVGQAMLETKSSDALEIKRVLPRVAEEYSGATGDIRLNEAGDLAHSDYEIWGIRDGAWTEIGRYSYADDSISVDAGLQGVVTVGSIAPITGDLLAITEENLEAMMLAEDDFNDYLDKLGEPWRLDIMSEDSETEPAVALERIMSLDARGIDLVIGPETSANINAVKEYADASGMLIVSCCSSAPVLAIPGDSVYRLVPDDTNQGAAIAGLMRGEGIETVVPVWRGDTWGDGISEAASGSFAGLGGTVAGGIRYDPHDPRASESASLLAKSVQEEIDAAGADRVAVLFLGFEEISQFVRSAAGHGPLADVRWFVSSANNDDPNLVSDPEALEFSTATRLTALQVSPSKTPAYERVHAHIEGELGRVPTSYAYASYDAVWIMGRAILETGSADATRIKQVLPEMAEEHNGIIGGTRLNDAGDLAHADYEIWGIRDGGWTQVGLYDHAGNSASEAKTVGLLLPMTGDLKLIGHEAREATMLAAGDFNAYLNELGQLWRLDIVLEDSETDPDAALERIMSLDARGISTVIGPVTSANTDRIRGYADSNDMLLVSCCSSDPKLAIPGDSVYRLIPDDTSRGAAFAKLLASEGIEVVVPAWRGDTWGDGLRDATASSFEELGGTVADGVRYEPGTREFSAATSLLAEQVQEQLDGAGEGRVAVLLLGFDEILQFMQSAAGHDPLGRAMWLGPGANDPELVEDPAVLAFSIETRFVSLQHAPSRSPTYEHVQEQMTETLGRTPNSEVHSSYDAVWLVGLSMLETGSADAAGIKRVLPQIAGEHDGAVGSTRLNEAGDLAHANYEIWRILDEGWTEVGHYNQADDSIEYWQASPNLP